MQGNLFKNLWPVRIGIIISMLTLLYGFGLGVAFGVSEDQIKGFLKNSAEEVFESVYHNNVKKMEKTTKKSWSYFKRAHLHAGAMGTTAVALILLLSCFGIQEILKTLISIALGIGSLGYPLFWMLAGIKAPGLGSTHAAKESLAWLAIPASGMFVMGVLSVFGIFIYLLLTSDSD